MSIISSSNYQEILQSINTVKKAFDQQSWNHQNQLEVLRLKISYMQKQWQQKQSRYQELRTKQIKDHQNLQSNIKRVKDQRTQKKVQFPILNGSQKINLSEKMQSNREQLNFHFQQLETLTNNAKISIKKTCQKGESCCLRKIKEMQQKIQDKTNYFLKQIKQKQLLLKSQVRQCEVQLLKFRQQAKFDETFIKQLQQFSDETVRRIESISNKRRNKKQKFFSLLQAIITKLRIQTIGE